MEGLLFFWISWMVWIYTTFLLDKSNPLRLKISFCILVMITLSPHYVTIMGFDIYLASLFLILFMISQVVQLKRSTIVYFFITSITVMIGYVSFHLLELFDPVWVIINREWMLAIALVYLTLMLQSNRFLRYTTLLTGAVQGEILFSVILRNYSFHYPIGTMGFLDTAALSAGVLMLWNGIELAVSFIEKHFQHQEREKQKLS